MLIIMVIATLSSTMMCEAMSRIPGNDKFQVRSYTPQCYLSPVLFENFFMPKKNDNFDIFNF